MLVVANVWALCRTVQGHYLSLRTNQFKLRPGSTNSYSRLLSSRLALFRRIRAPDAMILPTNSTYSPEEGGLSNRSAVDFSIPVIFRRIHRLQQMVSGDPFFQVMDS